MSEESKKSSVPGMMATFLATVTSALIGSRFGLQGTMVGGAVGTLLTTAATQLYEHFLTRGHETLRMKLTKKREQGSTPVQVTHRRADADTRYFSGYLLGPPPERPLQPMRRPWYRDWRKLAPITAAPFVAALITLTVVELAVGHPLSGGNSGTTLTGLVGQPTHTRPIPTTRRWLPETTEPSATSTRTHRSTTEDTTTTEPSRESSTSSTSTTTRTPHAVPSVTVVPTAPSS